MPTIKTFGTESAANHAIGGIPVIHYFDWQSRGRGQAVRLLLIDSGAAFTDVRYTFSEWPEQKISAKITGLNPCGTLVIAEMPNGKVLTQSYAMLRHWGRLLGAYDGKTEDEKYWADAICDIVIDWRTQFISAFFSTNQADYARHREGHRTTYLDAINKHLEDSDLSQQGPFVIGNVITYADLVLYQILHDENLVQDGRKGLQSYERLVKLVDAVEERPNIKKFLNSTDYLG